jgi:nucleoside-triphosphatase
MANPPHILLLTGRPGVGKTTAILRIADCVAPRRVAGFITEELREGGVRRGFRLETFGGYVTVMAHVDFPKKRRVGKYGVDLEAIDAAVAEALAAVPADVYCRPSAGMRQFWSRD